MTDDVREVIEKLAVALHTTADKVWEILVWQGRVGAIGNMAECLIPAILMLAFVVRWHPQVWAYVRDEPRTYDEDWPGVVLVVGWTATLIGVVLLPIIVGNQIVRLLNPDYWALNEILALIKR